MIAVLCRSTAQYNDFINFWVHHDDREIFHRVSTIDDMRGREFTEVIRIGTYHKTTEYDRLYYMLQQKISLGNKGAIT
jgi:hypothetical protein